jgi:crotonobetainyl-CoA:carnitine CoA-transferase CaiB-like acyl-CoA transferase
MMSKPVTGLLAGLRVLDASRVLAGPLCGQVLGDLGAEVVKVERPGQGDDTRSWGPPFTRSASPDEDVYSFSAYFLSCNRNKRAITLDLANPQGQAIFHDLVRHSDVVLENFRAASAEKLGLGPGKLLEINPHVVVCSLSGFGRTGPWHDRPGYDFAIQALSGLMAITGPPEGPPCKVGVAVTDVLTGLYAAVAILACLQARQRSGHGYTIDLALLDCAVAAQVNLAQAYLTSGEVPPRQGNAHLQIVPYQLFATADSWLVLAVGNDGQWQRWCQCAGQPQLAGDPRFSSNPLRVENRTTLVPLVAEAMRLRATAEWCTLFEQAGVPHAAVASYAEVFASPQAAPRSLKIQVHDPQGQPLDLIGPPFHLSSPGEEPTLPEPLAPPTLGQDTDAILTEWLGFSPERLRELRQGGVI